MEFVIAVVQADITPIVQKYVHYVQLDVRLAYLQQIAKVVRVDMHI
jgi:hypothetical protein